jgi:lipopolysaccharide export system permease protein
LYTCQSKRPGWHRKRRRFNPPRHHACKDKFDSFGVLEEVKRRICKISESFRLFQANCEAGKRAAELQSPPNGAATGRRHDYIVSMNLFTRYVLREVCQIFLLTLTALTFVMLLFGVGAEAIKQGLGPVHLIQLLPYLLPNALLFAIPGTILLATSMVYGRMSNFGEIVAIKSLGVSPMAVIWPTLILSMVLSLVTVWLNDVAVSWGFDGGRKVVINAVEDIIYGMLRTQKSFSSKTFSINVKRVEEHILVQPVITFYRNGDSPEVTITAQEAEFRSKPGSGLLTIVCRDGEIDMDGTTIRFPDEIEREIPLDQASGKSVGDVSPAHVAMSEIPERVAKQKVAIERGQQLLAAKAGFRMMTGDFSQLGGTAWSSQAAPLTTLKTNLYKLQTEPPRRWANGFSCLCFTLVGAPLAIRLRNSDVLTSFFACFGPILILYYPLMAFGLDRSKAGAAHPMIVWLANAILVVWGLWLLRRVVRY